MHDIDSHLGVDDLADEVIQRFIKLLLVLACNDLNVLYEIGEVQTNEVDSRVALYPLYINKIKVN